MSKPLEGVRVLELARILADLGAHIVQGDHDAAGVRGKRCANS